MKIQRIKKRLNNHQEKYTMSSIKFKDSACGDPLNKNLEIMTFLRDGEEMGCLQAQISLPNVEIQVKDRWAFTKLRKRYGYHRNMFERAGS